MSDRAIGDRVRGRGSGVCECVCPRVCDVSLPVRVYEKSYNNCQMGAKPQSFSKARFLYLVVAFPPPHEFALRGLLL